MRLSTKAAGLLLAVVQLLGHSVIASQSTSISNHCFTKCAAGAKNSIHTSSSTTTEHCTRHATITTTKVSTVVPASKTSTKTVSTTSTKSVTASQQTDTFTSTSTSTSMTTSTSIVVSTSVSTITGSTSTTSTSTVSASGAFTPIASEPAIIAAGGGSLYPTLVPKKRSNRSPLADMREATVEERSTGKSLDSSKKAETCPKGTAQCPKGQSEKEVDCVKTVEIITTLTSTKTASRTTTVPASTKTVTVTKSFTATQTVANPDASTTVTSSASTTITVTATSTTSTIVTTDTTTTTTAVATAYAACQPDNMISYVNNNGISSFTPDNDGKYGNADSAYDCCVQCENALQCAGFQFYPPTGFCALYNSANQGTSCDASVASWGFYTSTGTVNVPVVGNGECGQATYHGN